MEEQFYLLWPWLMRVGRVRVLAGVNAAMLAVAYGTLWVLAATGHGADMAIWGNTLVQMQFFAVGSLLAMGLRVWRPDVPGWGRLLLGGMCAAAWTTAVGVPGEAVRCDDCAGSGVRGVWADRGRGGVPVFGGVWGAGGTGTGGTGAGVPGTRELRAVCVSHPDDQRGWAAVEGGGLPAVQGSAAMLLVPLGMTVVAAVASFELYERPFLRWKGRWTFVRSRDDGGRRPVGGTEPMAEGLATRGG